MRTTWRGGFAQCLLVLAFLAVAVELVRTQALEAQALQAQARSQVLHHERVPAIRGPILDRNGEPLAVSTPVPSVYAQPDQVGPDPDPQRIQRLAGILGMDSDTVRDRFASNSPFVYLKRQVPPQAAQRVEDLHLSGIGTHREYRRYYPAGEVAAHAVGLAGVDGQGLEGVELAFNETLAGQAGLRLVERDALGRDIRTARIERPVERGEALRLSLDGRLQYTAYQALKGAVAQHDAKAGMVAVLDPRTGEILALANVPSYNPNRVARSRPGARRNRAVTDALEPGSIFKPFTVASALEDDLIEPADRIQCEQGLLRVSGNTIHDAHPMGRVTVRKVIQKSSNIGAAKIALRQDNADFWRHLRDLGFGVRPGTGFPGETRGVVHPPSQWQSFERATIGFGQGVAVSTLQMARAYAVLANDGVRLPVTLRHLEAESPPEGNRVLSSETADQVTRMLEMAVSPEGTGSRAAFEDYRVAGKTGTAQKAGPGGYQEEKFVASFAGFAPVEDPRLVTVVMLDEPQDSHYGGEVAAPLFRRIMMQGLRLERVPPAPGSGTQPPPLPAKQVQQQPPERGAAT